MKHHLIVAIILSAVLLICPPSRAQSPEQKGYEIVKASEIRDDGFRDFTATMVMVLKNKHGQTSKRNIRIRVLEVKDDGNRSLMIFDNPRDVKGTAFLSHSHKQGDDDQWLYMPALKRVKRISSRNKSGSFMGSEFSYEDIASQELEKYTYKWIRDETCEGGDCFVIERYPVDRKNSGYTRQVVWLDKQEYRVYRVEYYDRKHSHLKTLTFSGYEKFLGKYWRAGQMQMQNLQSGKSTRLSWSDYRFQTGLNPADFTKTSLKRAR